MHLNKTFLLMCMVGMVMSCHAMDLCVAPDGANNQTGNVSTPLATVQGALARAALVIKERGYPTQGLRIRIKPGQYTFTDSLKWPSLCQGTRAYPFTLIGNAQAKPIFQGGLPIDLAEAQLVQDKTELQRLHTQARGRVYVVQIEKSTQCHLLGDIRTRLSYRGRTMQIARYPNVGYGHIEGILDAGAIYAHGRTPGAPPSYTMEDPIGGTFTLSNKAIEAWQREFRHSQKARVIGYLSYDWYKENHRIARIEKGCIQLLEYSRYGILNREKIPRRVIIKNLLCELDEPGEFFFDEENSKLYFWPYGDDLDSLALTLWAGQPFVELQNLKHISFQNLIVEGVAQGHAALVIKDCKQVSLAGCTVRNCARPAVIIEGGTQCGLRSCDLYDLPHHLTLNGGDTRCLVPAGHYAENCHFTQVQATDYYGRIQIRGVGQVFRHNLVHNFIGQVMTVGGNDHRIEYNEFFNIGIEEGDGGTIYSGAQMWSWGNLYRHNFLHHLMCVPQAHPRGGIYPDDRDQGDTIANNLFYKAAHRAVLINGGAGHTVRNNVFLRGYIGIYNTEGGSDRVYRDQARYDAGELKRGDKTDYIWRTEQAIGKEGWNKEPWVSHYPLFQKIMNQERRRFWPIECDFSNNCFSANFRNIEYRFAGGEQGVKDVQEVPHIRAENNRSIPMSAFRDPNHMDFSYQGNWGRMLPDIQFKDIGLITDEFRTQTPDKQVYRQAVQQHFAARPSYDPSARYDPDTINGLIYFNTGKLMQKP